MRGLQRYRCKTCGFHFTATPKRGRSEATKALAVLFYSFGKASFRWLGKLLGVSGLSTYKWVRQAAETLPEPEVREKSGKWNWMNCGISSKQKKPRWIRKAYNHDSRRCVSWVVGGRDHVTLR